MSVQKNEKTQTVQQQIKEFIALNKKIRVLYALGKIQDTKNEEAFAAQHPPLALELFLATLPRTFIAKTTYPTAQQESLFYILGEQWHDIMYGPLALVLTPQEFDAWKSTGDTYALLSTIHETILYWLIYLQQQKRTLWTDQDIFLYFILLHVCYSFELVNDFNTIHDRVIKILDGVEPSNDTSDLLFHKLIDVVLSPPSDPTTPIGSKVLLQPNISIYGKSLLNCIR